MGDKMRNNIFDNEVCIKKYVNQLEIINLGSGASYNGIDFSFCTNKYCSFARAPQSFEYDFKLLREYSSLLKEKCIVLIVVTCPLSFGRAKKTTKERISRGLRYVHYLPQKEICDINRIVYYLEKFLFLFSNIKKMIQAIKGNSSSNIQCKDKKKQADELLEVWLRQAELTDLKNANQAAEQIDDIQIRIQHLKNIVDYCKAKKYRPIIVIPPISRYLKSYISDEFLDAFMYKNIEMASGDDTPIFDYCNDERFSQLELYSNGLFLEEKGRILFSEILWNDIDSYLHGGQIC
jgi:hypothetical protein